MSLPIARLLLNKPSIDQTTWGKQFEIVAADHTETGRIKIQVRHARISPEPLWIELPCTSLDSMAPHARINGVWCGLEDRSVVWRIHLVTPPPRYPTELSADELIESCRRLSRIPVYTISRADMDRLIGLPMLPGAMPRELLTRTGTALDLVREREHPREAEAEAETEAGAEAEAEDDAEEATD